MEFEERKVAEDMRRKYVQKETGKLDELKKLDKKAKTPALVFAYLFGTLGALVLGVGMCLAMKVIGNLMPVGIVVGIVGIAMVSVNYFIYSLILKRGKAKYRKRILELSDEVLNQ